MQGSSKHLNPLWKPWVLIATLIAVLAVMAGVPPFFIAIVAICPLMMATMHGGQAGHNHGELSHHSGGDTLVRSQPTGPRKSSIVEEEEAHR